MDEVPSAPTNSDITQLSPKNKVTPTANSSHLRFCETGCHCRDISAFGRRLRFNIVNSFYTSSICGHRTSHLSDASPALASRSRRDPFPKSDPNGMPASRTNLDQSTNRSIRTSVILNDIERYKLLSKPVHPLVGSVAHQRIFTPSSQRQGRVHWANAPTGQATAPPDLTPRGWTF